MKIFQKSVTNKYIKNIEKEKIDKAFKKFQKFYGDKLRLVNIMQLKEENYQEGFLREIFVQTLGYKINPDKNYNLTTEYKNQKDARKADGAIIKNGKAICVIELKSTKTKNLESIKEQAFGYKNNQPDCKYVITSNFQSLRFYVDNATEYEEFNLFNIDKEQFKFLYLLISKESIFKDLPAKIKKETKLHEIDISDKLYADYKQFKDKIFKSIVENNKQYDKLILFKKTQKLLDRFLFVFFAEDCGLIPPNTISKIVSDWKILKKLDFYQPLYKLFKNYFSYLNKGKKIEEWGEIPAYNGGLFRPDEILDKQDFKIDDIALEKDSLKISAYDFNTEIDVNILGHIFEHSLNEIEEITAKLEGTKINKKKSKRKIDGIFYTPKYITKYIVENTVGTICKEQKNKLKINNLLIDEKFHRKDGKLNQKGKQLYKILHDYKKWLLTLKILDPACGSGAFLNQTLDFLIAEHKMTDDLISELTGESLRLYDTDKAILENNIYGVDINEESVDIAKLSLWLRTAQKGRELSHLNNNIKCGNSLIDDSSLNYNKVFDWKKEFADIMKNGGFDIVIGNPPYIKEYTNREAFNHLRNHYCYQGKMDLWYFFGCIALELIKKETGLIGYIAPNNWITNSGASKFRNVILQKARLTEFIDFGNFKVFDSASIQTMIYIMKHSKDNNNYEFNYSKIIENNINHELNQQFLEKLPDKHFLYFKTTLNKEKYLNKTINFNTKDIKRILNKIKDKQNFILEEKELANAIIPNPDYLNSRILKKIPSSKIKKFNIKKGDGVFVVNKNYFKNINDTEKKYLKPLVEATEVSKYYFPEVFNKNIIYFTKKNFDGKNCPNLINHLKKFKEIMLERRETANKRMEFFHIHWSRDENFFKKGDKILSVRKCSKPTFIYTDKEVYVTGKFYILKSERIDLKYLTALLNSKLIEFWLRFKGKMQGYNYQIDKAPLLNLPIIEPNKKTQIEIANLVSKIIENKQKNLDYKKLLEQTKTENNFDREIRLTKKLEKIKTEIKTAENNIDSFIYKLYKLSNNDIYNIENEINK